MTWDELKEKAKELGCSEFGASTIKQRIKSNYMLYYKEGVVLFYDTKLCKQKTIASNRTFEQMLKIMEALQ